MLSRSNSTHQDKKITRSNLVEQLREYQIRTKNDWASVSLFSPSSNLYNSRTNRTDFPVLELANENMDIGNNLDERKSDASSGAQDINADLHVNGPIDDHKDIDNISTDTHLPVEDFNERGTKEEVINELREMSKDGAGLLESAPDRVDVVIFVIWELVILAFLVFSAVSLYYRQLKLALILASISLLLLLCMKVTKHVKLAHKKKRRMLLPLSM